MRAATTEAKKLDKRWGEASAGGTRINATAGSRNVTGATLINDEIHHAGRIYISYILIYVTTHLS